MLILACENSRPSSLPARVAPLGPGAKKDGCFRRLCWFSWDSSRAISYLAPRLTKFQPGLPSSNFSSGWNSPCNRALSPSKISIYSSIKYLSIPPLQKGFFFWDVLPPPVPELRNFGSRLCTSRRVLKNTKTQNTHDKGRLIFYWYSKRMWVLPVTLVPIPESIPFSFQFYSEPRFHVNQSAFFRACAPRFSLLLQLFVQNRKVLKRRLKFRSFSVMMVFICL